MNVYFVVFFVTAETRDKQIAAVSYRLLKQHSRQAGSRQYELIGCSLL